jgi:hypothetical protein
VGKTPTYYARESTKKKRVVYALFRLTDVTLCHWQVFFLPVKNFLVRAYTLEQRTLTEGEEAQYD